MLDPELLCERAGLPPWMVRKRLFLSHLCINRSFYQDRLETNVGKVEKKVAFFAAGAAVRILGA
eukprot:COSAG06_NODE_889_length_11746_cov_48.163733_4_plen_64_part_00